MKKRIVLLIAILALAALTVCNISVFSGDVSAAPALASDSKGLVLIGRTPDGKYIWHCQAGLGFPCTQCSLVLVTKVIPIGESAK